MAAEGIKLRLKTVRGVVEVTPAIVVAGLDFGFSDPLALEVAAKIGSLWVNFYEVYEERLGIGEVLKIILHTSRNFQIERIWADSEDPKMIEYLQGHGCPVVPNQIKNIDYGIRTLYGLMKQTIDHPVMGPGPKWRVDKGACPNLVREMGLYGHAVVRGEVRTGKPIDRHNHGLDAVRYYVTGEGEMPAELYTPEQEHRKGLYNKDGRWYDDPVGYQIERARRNRTEPGEWWDERMGSLLEQDDIVGIDDILT
jgi:hypothetical protein